MITFESIYNEIINIISGEIGVNVLNIVGASAPIFLAFILALIFWPLWVNYVRSSFFLSQKTSLLEIRIPKEHFRSPHAMELFLTSLHQTGGEGTWYDKYWLGKTRPWFSLEMVSINGQVKFFIWTRDSQRSFIETSLYAQFPGIEVTVVPDYTKDVFFDPKENNIFAVQMMLTKPDPYPIKTYVDYGLDKDPKEEFKVDPLTPLIEYLGSVGNNQQTWIQIVIRAHKKEQIKPGHIWKTTDAWIDEAKAEIDKILVRDPKTKVSGMKDEATGFTKLPTISKGEQGIVEALERSITKLPFDVGIRALYIAKKDVFDGSNIGMILGGFKQFGSEHLNGFRPNDDKYSRVFSYPWQDFKDYRQNRARALALYAYKRRMYFYEPVKETPFILNSEELATIFHFPGSVAGTPNLDRVASKKSQAPANLPI